jgi:hypothetical protein
MVPFYAVLLRLGLFLGIGILGVSIFPEIGAPIIAFAEIALLIEAVILLIWLSRRTHEPLKTEQCHYQGIACCGRWRRGHLRHRALPARRSHRHCHHRHVHRRRHRAGNGLV